jgi:uncharacterized spore protein YtfJ
MNNEMLLENLGAGFFKTASIKNVFGEPITAGEKTIIPVASIAYGFGGGYGNGNKMKKLAADKALPGDLPEGEGAGGGGGLHARAKGVFEVTPTGVNYIPANPIKQIAVGILIGFLLKTLFFSKRTKK